MSRSEQMKLEIEMIVRNQPKLAAHLLTKNNALTGKD